MIELLNFSKKYSHNKEFAVKNVNMVLENGSITGLLGLNGSGKTTILKAICGFHFPTEGNITVSDKCGKIWNIQDNPQMCMNLIGYVPEISCLPPDMRTIDFLHYTAKLHGLSREQEESAAARVIRNCDLQRILTKKIKQLSKGQQQRVSFAQALIYNPQNLILDEPVSGLDPAQIIQMRELILKLSKDKAILLSTHILQEVYSLCTRLYILNNGRIVASGTEKEVVHNANTENFEQAFIKLTKPKESAEKSE